MSTYNNSLNFTFISEYLMPSKRPVEFSGEVLRSGINSSLKNALCLDDDPLSLRLVEALLKEDYNVYSCTTMRQVLSILESQRIDIFICDYHLGADFTGAKALNILKRLDLFTAYDKILITARPSPEVETEVLAAGFNHIFSKPLGRSFKQHCLLQA